jgi:hypothetical protein
MNYGIKVPDCTVERNLNNRHRETQSTKIRFVVLLTIASSNL